MTSKEWKWDLDTAGQFKPLCLSVNELLVLDWVLCSASRLIPDATMDALVTGWGDLRQTVWSHLAKLDMLKLPDHERDVPRCEIGQYLQDMDAKALMAVVPTTMRWGTSHADSGYDLKVKLYRFLSNDYPVEVKEEASDASSTSPHKAPDLT